MTDTPSIVPGPPEQAKPFHAMAARIEHNANTRFGGAFVIVPPAEGGAALEVLVLDESQNAAQFWMVLNAKCKQALDEIAAKEAQNSSIYGRR